ncbi:MAG: winged helix-turn-helix transcriptional regulator [Acidobacteria bacterium]|nr:winged helix-turn-helix transcriptional regulator [Acidobacteriota bacterium]
MRKKIDRLTNPALLPLIADYFKILGEPLRLKILRSLSDGEKSVNEIVDEVRSSQPNVSKHLGLLITAGFVIRRPEKNLVFYSIADENLWKLCHLQCSGNL